MELMECKYIKMKHLLTYILLFSAFVSCNTSDNTSLDEQKNEDSVTIELPKVQGDFAIYEYDLRMYNVPYLLRIIPSIDTTQNTYQTNIVLTQNGDTIFNKLINADSLFNSIASYKDNPKYIEYLNKNELYKNLDTFKLERVLYRAVRTDDLFFTSLFCSENGEELYVNFQITYLGKDVKKLFVNGVYDDKKEIR